MQFVTGDPSYVINSYSGMIHFNKQQKAYTNFCHNESNMVIWMKNVPGYFVVFKNVVYFV